MRIFFFVFFCSFSAFAQNPKLKVKINSITTFPVHNSATEYHINYQIENETTNELSFFLIPNALIANSASSLTLFPVYKMYQNGVFEDMDGPFFEYETKDDLEYSKIENKESEEAKNLLKKIQISQGTIAMDNYKKYKDNGGESEDFQWIYYRQRLLNSVVTMKPNETKTFTIKTLWNKNRYIKNDDLEFYLDQNNTIEIELILDLKTNLFQDQLTKEDLQNINKNPSFISGQFTSNKMKIEFKD
ncbi:hypothetical protein WFZ85_03900 [Flavobacterium sp. j3]|uniref:GLPGLI family protein n=1 Tax=Flavobacterium aureirubrum TaxID=3133147 RepID=A0ABU9N3K4_9FLAO